MWQRFTEKARRAVFYAQDAAQRSGHDYVGTEHLLLGLIRDPDTAASRVLEAAFVRRVQIQADLERMMPQGKSRPSVDMTLNPTCKSAIDLAYDEARKLSVNYIGTEHLLLGLFRENKGLAGRLLAASGATLETLQRGTMAVQAKGGEAPTEPIISRSPAPDMTHVAKAIPLMGADLLALVLLDEPSEALVEALKTVGQDAQTLARAVQVQLMGSPAFNVPDSPSTSSILDSRLDAVGVFGRIACSPRCATHQALLALGVTAEAIKEAFSE